MIYSRDLIFAICHIFFYNPYIRNYWRGLYFRVSMLSRIYAKIKSSWIKNVLQYKNTHRKDINLHSQECRGQSTWWYQHRWRGSLDLTRTWPLTSDPPPLSDLLLMDDAPNLWRTENTKDELTEILYMQKYICEQFFSDWILSDIINMMFFLFKIFDVSYWHHYVSLT